MYTDSRENNITKKNWLPRGLINVICGKVIQFYNKQSVVIDKLGK